MGESRDVYVEIDERAVIRTADVYQTEVEAGTAGYSETLLTVVANFKNSGAPEGFNAQSMVGKSKRGEVAVRFFAVVDPGTETFTNAGFKTRGCLAMTACASVACSMIEGKTFEQALSITPENVKEALDGVPSDKVYTTYFATEGIRALIGDYLINQGSTTEQLDQRVECDEFSVSCSMCEHCSLRTARIELRFGADSNHAEDAEQAARELQERNALALVFDDVRVQSAESSLVVPAQWAERGIIPPHLTDEEFEMLVYNYLEEQRAERACLEVETPPAPAPVFRTATRMVGVPQPFGVTASADDADHLSSPETEQPQEASSAAVLSHTSNAINQQEMVEMVDDIEVEVSADNPFPGLKIPAGYRLVELEGEYVLVEDESAQPAELTINCQHITTLEGVQSYYLYDSQLMTDTYANWAFLAAEDNTIVTFAHCVREDSRVYPRPLASSNLKNPPFNMSNEDIALAWAAVQESGEYPDIERTEASNGDEYFYSTKYLSATYANSLAEWDAVERRLAL